MAKLRVQMVPNALNLVSGESGIHTLVRKYFEHAKEGTDYSFEFAAPNDMSFDVLAVHAGMTNEIPNSAPMVAHLHGLYWTADLPVQEWQHRANKSVINSIRYSTVVTVPSQWVAETFRRDAHMNPIVIPHGIDVKEWLHDEPNEGYVLWNKNRDSDVCDPIAVNVLAKYSPNTKFMSTFAKEGATPNVKTTGVVKHDVMRRMVQRCNVYLSTAKETFGIGILEAMAAGKPVLAFGHGGVLNLIEHGVSGYLAKPDDYDDLMKGLAYCQRHAAVLGANGRRIVYKRSWHRTMRMLSDTYQMAYDLYNAVPSITVVIPCFNKAETLERAVRSAVNQNAVEHEVIIVDNNSGDDSYDIARMLEAEFENVSVLKCGAQGVAHARNMGIFNATTKYVCCLDADDEIQPDFLNACVSALESDASIGMAYTKLEAVNPDGTSKISDWPDEYDYNRSLQRHNPVPTCCVFKREAALRLGGYRQRYAPTGAGSEDAEFWLRMGSLGLAGKLVDQRPLFRYHLGGAVSGNPSYREKDWLGWHPWVADRQHPILSIARPVNNVSHSVRQYDEPLISVVIPCSKDHVGHLIDALDSLEAQTFRKWEAIVVLDGVEVPSMLVESFPFVRWAWMKENVGAGACRNKGASMARAKLLLFLDADDWLDPKCMEQLYSVNRVDGAITYSDYLGYATIDMDMASKLRIDNRLVEYNNESQEAVIKHYAADYDCARAQRQPELNQGQFYIWNLITSLVSKEIFDEVGGFDETMVSWEDWDLWLRIAKRGHCFERVKMPLVHYRFGTGSRREIGRQEHESLLSYLSEKYEREEVMPCGGCGGRSNRKGNAVRPPAAVSGAGVGGSAKILQMTSENMIMVRLIDGNHGGHPIRIRDHSDNRMYDYNYHKHGDEFLIREDHATRYPDKFQRVLPTAKREVKMPETVVEQVEESLSAPNDLAELYALPLDDLMELGLSKRQMREFREIHNLISFSDVATAPMDTLLKVKGIGTVTARRIQRLAGTKV